MNRLILPLPPSVNHAYRNYRHKSGRRMRVPTRDAEKFKTEASWRAIEWRQKNGWTIPGEKQKVIVRMWVWWKSGQRRDTDNTFKLTLDSLTGVLYVDDHMCLPRVMDFGVDKQNPRLEIEIELLEGEH